MADPADDFIVRFLEQIEFLRQKVSLPTRTWRDIDGRAHDRAFVVAGVERDEVLTAIRAAVERAIAEGQTLTWFRQELDAIVARHGWIGGAGEDRPAWRARVIYETNVRTSYMAGRLAQMRHPDIVKLRPFWAYRHADIRVPLRPREQHKGWDGLVLRHDDPWWDTHYPPNGWGCTCGVRPLSRREMARHQAARGKPEAVDVAPAGLDRAVTDPLTGEQRLVPAGIGEGWDHQPGDAWERGLAASPGLPSLPQIAEPIGAAVARPGRPQTDYIDGFLGAFGARRGPGGATLFRDAAGQVVVISEQMLQRAGSTRWKTRKKAGARELHLDRMAEAIKDPDEIWIDWVRDPTGIVRRLERRYLRYDPADSGFAAFAYAPGFGWSGLTTFPPKIGDHDAAETYLSVRRTGALLYRRGS